MPKQILLAICAIICALIIGLIGCADKSPVNDDDISATWGDTAMTVAQFKHKMHVRHRNEAQASKQTFKERMNIISEYVIRDCKILEGYRLGFDQRADVLEAYDRQMEMETMQLLFNIRIRDPLFPDEVIQTYWEHDREEVRCRHILVKVEPDATPADTLDAWRRINEVYTKATGEGTDFSRLVDLYSEDESISRQYHGDLGFFKWGKMVDEFQDAAWELQPGDISPVVRSPFGYHIIKMVERRPTGLEVRTSHILVKVSKRSSPPETTLAYDRAMMILEQVQQSDADFAQIARRYSEDKKTWINGDIGWIPRGSMPSEYWDVALEMEVGQIEGPVRTYQGYHIMKMTDSRVEPRPLDDPEVRDRVLSKLSRLNRDTMATLTEQFLLDAEREAEMEIVAGTVQLLMRKLGDPMIPTNMSPFSAFTAEDRELFVVRDNTENGGVTIQDLVDQYGDHRMPFEYRDDPTFITELLSPITTPKYLKELVRSQGLYDNPEA
ncbi:MAG: peptidylprolyl isomerase, partial [Candidatus Electryoneaceae bacterium]|nr:peptidylprolyl isomerase [Candidatus Electryoneaceae bacterium]